MPDGTIGVRAWGTLTKADYTDALLPPLLELLGRDQKVRLLFQLGPDFDELEPGGDLGGREVRGPPGDPAPDGRLVERWPIAQESATFSRRKLHHRRDGRAAEGAALEMLLTA